MADWIKLSDRWTINLDTVVRVICDEGKCRVSTADTSHGAFVVEGNEAKALQEALRQRAKDPFDHDAEVSP